MHSSLGYQPMKYWNQENNEALKKMCPWINDPNTKREIVYDCSEDNRPKYRKIDGSCNHLSTPQLGKSNTPFQRLLIADYGRNGTLRSNKRGKDLPPVRNLSNSLRKSTDQEKGTSAFMTVFVMQMGQFVGNYSVLYL